MNPADPPEAATWCRSAALVSLLVLAILAWTAYAAFVLGDASAYDEHGFLENCHAALLLLSTLVALHATATGYAADRAVLMIFAWTCFGMALRELDLDQIDGVPPWLSQLGTGRVRTPLLGGGFLVLGAFTVLQRWRHGHAIFGLLQRRSVLLMMMAALWLIASRGFETQSSLPHHVFLEETAELLAFGLILQVALRLWRRTRQRGPRAVAAGLEMAGQGGPGR